MEKFFIHHVSAKGEPVSEIAALYGCTTDEIWAFNPQYRPTQFIYPDCTLRIPQEPAPPPPPPLPPLLFTKSSSLSPTPLPTCGEELVDVVHVTGEQYFHVLTSQESKELKQEIAVVRKLMDDYHQQMSAAGAATQCHKADRPTAQCSCITCRQNRWAVDADAAGVLTFVEPPPQRQRRLSTDEDLDGQLATLNQARDWYRDYNPTWMSPSWLETNWRAMQNQKILDIDKQRTVLAEQIRERRAVAKKRKAAVTMAPVSARASALSPDNDSKTEEEEKKPGDSATNANDATADLKYGKGRSSRTEVGQHNRSGITVVEVILFSDPSRRHYIPVRYRERSRWAQKVSTRVMAGKPFNRQLAGELLKDIQAQLSESRKAGPLGALEFKLAQWASQDDNLLNALHQELTWTHNGEGAIPYAVNAEAHALRFAASASAGINSWNPREGSVDIGVKGSAAFSMAEASASLQAFFPNPRGFVASMDYRNGEGQTVSHPIGVFRLEGKLELSCFAGARIQGEAALNVQYRPAEVTSGASALLGTPTLGVSRGASIGVKAGGFAGAQVGGTLTGSLKWLEPDTSESGERVLTEFAEGVAGQTLAEIRAEGNAALGVGISGEFGISIHKERLVINCAGAMVLGPGAGGGFSTEVDLEQVGKLTMLLCNALSEVHYRLLLSVSQDAFDYICRGLLRTATATANNTLETFEMTLSEIRNWWNERSASWDESERLVRHVLRHRTDKIMMVAGEVVPLRLLPPQTLGPMLYLVIEGCPFAVTEHFEEALVILVSEITTWRQMIEVLEHTSPRGEKVVAMHTLEKINALLDGKEQTQFNEFLENLIVGRPDGYKRRKAWHVSYSSDKRARLFAARSNKLFNGLA